MSEANIWPSYRMARDLAGTVFPVSEAMILQLAKKTVSAARWVAPSYSPPTTANTSTRYFHAPQAR
jgi:hypothetical protein